MFSHSIKRMYSVALKRHPLQANAHDTLVCRSITCIMDCNQCTNCGNSKSLNPRGLSLSRHSPGSPSCSEGRTEEIAYLSLLTERKCARVCICAHRGRKKRAEPHLTSPLKKQKIVATSRPCNQKKRST